jgi:hypothetical protein
MTDQLTLGLHLKAQGQQRVDEAEHKKWKALADKVIRHLIWTGESFTAEDVRRLAGDPSRDNAIGARLSAWARTGKIRTVGYTQATRAPRHASLLRVWRGT